MGKLSEGTLENRREKHISVALLAHVDAGKTTLSEGLLYRAGKIRELGRVDKGNAYLDTFELEKERGITIFSKQAVFQSGQTEISLLDTPGHVDFSAEMERTLQVSDYAVLLISASDGVQGHTLTLWRLLQEYRIPTFFFVNKMDQPGTNRQVIMAELRERLSDGIIDFTHVSHPDTREQIALCDEDLLEKYLEGGEIHQDAIASLIAERKLYPCFFGSALKMEGVDNFLQGLDIYTRDKDYPSEFGARVFKVMRDRQGNRLTYMKVTGGTIVPRMEIFPDKPEKVNQIRIYSGERFETVSEARAGTICAVTGLMHTSPGQGLGYETQKVKPLLEPVLTYRLTVPEECHIANFLSKLRELEEEQPELHIVWNEELQEIHVQVMGEVQIEIIKRLIQERFQIDVDFDKGNIVYKETIYQPVEGVGHYEPLRHYAEVHLWMEPGELGSGIQIASECSEDALDKNWQRLILTHIMEKEHRGVLTGSGLTDVKITLVAGKAHLKHTEGGDFRQATYRAIRQGLMQTEAVLLEPYYEYCLEVPTENLGRAIHDVERMAGTFTLEQEKNGFSTLTGQAPVSTMRDYMRELISYTKGQGRLFCSVLGYRPCHNADEVVQAMRYDPERDMDNPTGSVFCSHGAGFYVPWNEVGDYMHIPMGNFYQTDKSTEVEDTGERKKNLAKEEEWIDVEEIDKILERTSHANRKSSVSSHKGISSRRVRSVPEKPVGLSRPRRKELPEKKYLLVDGYNVIFAWKELKELSQIDISATRDKLLDIMCNYQGYKKCELIVVFDAYRVQNHRTELLDYHNIHVVYTKEAETADQYIEKFAHENSKKYGITVASSDGLEQIIIRGEGCRLLSARDLEQEVQRVSEELRQWTDA